MPFWPEVPFYRKWSRNIAEAHILRNKGPTWLGEWSCTVQYWRAPPLEQGQLGTRQHVTWRKQIYILDVAIRTRLFSYYTCTVYGVCIYIDCLQESEKGMSLSWSKHRPFGSFSRTTSGQMVLPVKTPISSYVRMNLLYKSHVTECLYLVYTLC
jgi:hypothetical protein